MPKKKNTVRKDGLIQVQVYLGRDENGKRKYKTVYGATQKIADEKADEIKAQLKKGLNIQAQNDTFSKWADKWLKAKRNENVSKGRLVVLESHVKHLNHYLGHMPIVKIVKTDVQEIIFDLANDNPNTGKPMAHDTLLTLRNTAKNIFKLAISDNVLERNPVDDVKIPATINSELDDDSSSRRALSDIEQTWITDTPHRAQTAAMIMMYSGLRRGELIPLTWSDIDLDKRMISINKTSNFISGKTVIKRTAKTDKSLRDVKIPLKLVQYLTEESKSKISIYVCPAASGKLHTEGSWRAMWESYLCDLNIKYGDFSPFKDKPKSKFDHDKPFVIPKITPHWLRHTFATMLYLAGVDVREAMRQLGHKDIRTTMNIYTHLDEKHKEKSVDKLDEYLSCASNMQVKFSK